MKIHSFTFHFMCKWELINHSQLQKTYLNIIIDKPFHPKHCWRHLIWCYEIYILHAPQDMALATYWYWNCQQNYIILKQLTYEWQTPNPLILTLADDKITSAVVTHLLTCVIRWEGYDAVILPLLVCTMWQSWSEMY